MSRDDQTRERLLAIFREEAHEHLKNMVASLLTIRRQETGSGRPGKAIEELFRATHTLKGAARSVGMQEVEACCQAAESVMSRLTREEVDLTADLLELLQDTVAHVARSLTQPQSDDANRSLIRRLEVAAGSSSVTSMAADVSSSPASPSVPMPSPGSAAGDMREHVPDEASPAGEGMIRIGTSLLDEFTFRAEELVAAKLAASDHVHEAEKLVDAIAAMHRAIGASPEVHAVATAARTVLEQLKRGALALERSVDALQQVLLRVRMASAATFLDLLPLMVHDVAQETGKKVELSIEGAELELDRQVIEAISAPLIHLVRNAIDHGIESPEARVAAGKTPQGALHLSLTPCDGGNIEIRVADDGAGLDLDRIRETAVRSRLLTASEAATLGEEQVRDLVFHSGLSTSPVVSLVSGRGLGMSIVRERVEALGGTVRLDNRPRQGTAVTMVVPATITRFRGLLIRECGQHFLIPLNSVEQVLQAQIDQIKYIEGRSNIHWNDELLPCCRLRDVLKLEESESSPGDQPMMPCVVVASESHRVAVLVDAVEGDREALIKHFQAPLVRVRNVASAAILGNGELAIVLRAADLVQCNYEDRRGAATRAISPKRSVILVVDDSITTRTVEKNMLEMAGFEVRVAADGLEAWNMLTTDPVDLVVSDIDMPHMNGFELTERIRAHPEHKDLPIVLVTALESRDDKERGVRLGANAYVFKSSFVESNLLEIVNRLI